MFLKRKGFTLVELLIVIIVIGILAGGMMLSSGSASDSARASTLISELRNAKAAGVFWLTDNVSSTDAELALEWSNMASMRNIFKGYMDNPIKVDELLFEVVNRPDGDTFLVGKPNIEIKILKKAIGQSRGTLVDNQGDVIHSAVAVFDVYVIVR